MKRCSEEHGPVVVCVTGAAVPALESVGWNITLIVRKRGGVPAHLRGQGEPSQGPGRSGVL